MHLARLVQRLLGIVLLLSACSSKASDLTDAPGSFDGGADATAPDAAVDAAQLACTGAYCEDFESYPAGAITNNGTLGPWTTKVTGTVTLAAIDTVKPYSGTKSLHITVPAGATAGATLYKMVASGLVPGNNVFGRAMVFYSNDGGNAAPVGVHSWLFQGLGTSTAGGGAVSMNWGDGGANMQLNYHPFGAAEASVHGTAQMSAGMWHCVQWQYDGSGTTPADAAKVWVDGTVVVQVMQSQGWLFATPWSSFNFGFMHYQTLATPADVYLDDFALDGAMIPCP
jgi:hypothetical protein